MEISKSLLHIFHDDAAVRVFHEFTGFAASSVAFQWRSSLEQGTNATLVKLDTFVATAAASLRADGSENACTHQQSGPMKYSQCIFQLLLRN